jgi:hypothetical protein
MKDNDIDLESLREGLELHRKLVEQGLKPHGYRLADPVEKAKHRMHSGESWKDDQYHGKE